MRFRGLLLALFLLAQATPAMAQGLSLAPDIRLRSIDGRSSFALSDLRDKRAALVVFWASW